MNLVELDRTLCQLRLSRIADVLGDPAPPGPDRADGPNRPRRGARDR